MFLVFIVMTLFDHKMMLDNISYNSKTFTTIDYFYSMNVFITSFAPLGQKAYPTFSSNSLQLISSPI